MKTAGDAEIILSARTKALTTENTEVHKDINSSVLSVFPVVQDFQRAVMISPIMSGFDSSRSRCGYFSPPW
jgi:hypothetical protein